MMNKILVSALCAFSLSSFANFPEEAPGACGRGEYREAQFNQSKIKVVQKRRVDHDQFDCYYKVEMNADAYQANGLCPLSMTEAESKVFVDYDCESNFKAGDVVSGYLRVTAKQTYLQISKD